MLKLLGSRAKRSLNTSSNGHNTNSAIIHFTPGDLTSTTSFKGEVYPLVVLDNSVAGGQRMTALMSSSGRMSYSSPTFLRFWRPGFIEDPNALESKDRLKGMLKTFSREVTSLLESKTMDLMTATDSLMKSQGFLYEEDLFEQVFSDRAKSAEGGFAVHKFLFEGSKWIKDGQWSLNRTSSGPYISRPQWQQDLLVVAESITENDLQVFRDKVKNVLKSSEMRFKIESSTESILIKCLKVFSDEFYVNALTQNNPFKTIISDALLGIYIIDSQAHARELIMKLRCEEQFEYSKPLINSHLNNNNNSNIINIPLIKEPFCELEQVDFGQVPVYLIDPLETVEIDDGISVEHPNIIHVHVADPSDYVSGDMEAEAMKRAESVYLTEKKIPMLPERITELSTLKRSGIKTLTFSCKIDLETGDLKEPKIRRGFINNLKHFTYEEAERIKDNLDVDLIKKLSNLHLNYRKTRGHLNFEFPRGIAKLDQDNQCISVEVDDEKMIMKKSVAEMMIIAGRIAGEHLRDRGLPGPFRSQEITGKLETFNNFILESASLIEKYRILKEMSLASVSPTPQLHASMGLDAYVKVTSPLRRYLDLVTHKILKADKNIYGNEWFSKHLNRIRRQEIYNKRLGTAVNKYWIERFIWQEERLMNESLWTLTPLEKIKDGLWTVHVGEVANNFVVQVQNEKKNMDDLLGNQFNGRLLSKQWESIFRFELI